MGLSGKGIDKLRSSIWKSMESHWAHWKLQIEPVNRVPEDSR